jgi:type V secretory pathway adhesin AidA
MVILSTGYVGVGTASPDTLFHMRGAAATLTLESTGNTDDPTIMLQRNNNTGLAARIQLDNSGGDVFFDNTYDNDNGDIYFRTKGTTKRVTIKGSGSVGIGTAAPATIFHIHTDSASAQEIFFDNDGVGPVGITFRTDFATDDGLANFIRFDAADDGGNNTRYSTIESFIVDNTDTEEDGRLTFSTMVAGTDTETMHIVGGNVGIGTNAPDSKLEIAGGVIIHRLR